MGEAELIQRLVVVEEARKWLGTPYHHRGRVLGHGCDCAQLLASAFSDAGLIDYEEPLVYSKDWHLHRGEEKYIAQVERVLKRVDDDDRPVAKRPKDASFDPGDVLMFRLGRTYSHSAMVTQWPFIIHASAPAIMVEEVDIRGTPMSVLPTRVYSYWRD